MIYYETDSWLTQIFRWRGTVWGTVISSWLLITVYVAVAYWWCEKQGSDLGQMRKNILGSTVSFLLVFRANNAYKRYMEGKAALTQFFWTLRELVCTYLVFFTGGNRNRSLRWRRVGPTAKVLVPNEPDPDNDDSVISEEKLHGLRWCIICGIALQMHTRLLDEGLNKGSLSRKTKWLVDWDRYRIRGLCNEEEFKALDCHVRCVAIPQTLWDEPDLADYPEAKELFGTGEPSPVGPDNIEIDTSPSVRLTSFLVFKINEVAYRNMNDVRLQDKKWGMAERFVPVVTLLTIKLSRVYGEVSQIISTPLPFPYTHLCRMLLFLYFMCFPFFIQADLGPWANVGEFSLLAMALLGVDCIATELENPFGDDVNDLNMSDKIAALEQEIMTFLQLSGDESCQSNFIWQDFPPGIADDCVPPVTSYLALRSQVSSRGQATDVIWGGACSRQHLDVEQELDHDDAEFSDDS